MAPLPRTLVVNIRDHKDHRVEAIYIGRGSKWGNPFHFKNYNYERIPCIEAYARWLAQQPKLLADIGELRGQTLKCFCAPNICHGDVLATCADITGMDKIRDYVDAVMQMYGPSSRSLALLCVPEQHRRAVRDLVTRNRKLGSQR